MVIDVGLKGLVIYLLRAESHIIFICETSENALFVNTYTNEVPIINSIVKLIFWI
jgi:hypothetical protein